MMPVNNTMPLSASVCHLSGVGEVNNDVSVRRAWEQWARQASPGSGEQRDTAVRRLSDCLACHASLLDLSGLALTALPERFPAGLQCLNLDNNCLQNLPETLPDSLQELYVWDNQLTRLPRHLPVSLTCLGVERNQLAALPDTMPSSLVQLICKHNQLTSIPDNLPNSLERLDVEDNQLTSLPARLPVSLRCLYASNNQLRHLPAILPRFLRTLKVENNPLDSDYQARNDFLAKLMCWHEGIDIARWQSIYTEDHVGDFVTFLDKLHQGNNRSSAALRGQVGRWLDYLAQDGHGELRQHTFVLANEAMENCVDRASYYFTQMQTLQTEHQLLSRDVSLEEAVKAILVNFRLQTLHDIATRQVAARRAASPGFAEDLEIYLAYQYELRAPLALPVYSEMQFSEIAGLTDEDVHQARQTVLEAEKADFMHYWLAESALWTAILTKWDAEKRKAADDQYVEDIDEDNCKFKAEVDKRLRDLGIAVNDADARHGVSTQLAKELLYAQRYQLSREYLAEKQALSLLERFDPAVCHLSGVGEVDNNVSLRRAWEQWARQAPPGSGERRDKAVRRLKNCLKRHASSLNLSGLALTALPERFPAGLQYLNLADNCLQNLPETLPDSLQKLSVWDNQLTCLPRRLPVSLKRLRVERNQLAALPDTMPSSLNQLLVADNQLTHLPDNLPISLEQLSVENNQLTRLPDNLPASLRWLYLEHNQLTSIPDNLPHSLESLDVSNNQLTSLPARLPVSLIYLYASNNQLRHLPAILPPFLRTLDVENNPLDSDSQARNDFLAKLTCWHEGIGIARWQSIYTEPHAGDFATFLDKLHQGNNRSSAALRGQVGRWLDYLAQDGHGELRGKTFVLANEAMASGVDRASYYFTQMQTLQTEHQLLSRDVSPEEVVKAILVNFRLQTLYDIATRQVAARRAVSPGFDEDLEIYLAYQYELRAPLALPVYSEMQFSQIAGLTDEDVHQARQTVLEAEKADFMHYWLTKSALWTAILTKWDAEKRKAADDQYVEDIAEDNCKFKAEVDKRLRDLGIAVNDADARHGVSTQLAKELLYAQRYQLSREYLAEKQALSLLERFDSAVCHLSGIGEIDNNVSLWRAWEQWARQAPPDSGEQRDMAVRRLSDCLKRHASLLDLSGLALTALPERFPAGLQYLNLADNCLKNLPETLPYSLQELYVWDNQLTRLPRRLPVSLKRLRVERNQLAALPDTMPSSLKVININSNKLTSLPSSLPAYLEYLYASDNLLTDLPERLPDSLKKLNVAENQLTSLPSSLPASLKSLIVNYNSLTGLPERLPALLRTMDVHHNRLESLPSSLPAYLKYLYAGNNLLTDLPESLPDSLKELNVAENQLTSLPARLPVSLRCLCARNNRLTHLPDNLPDSLEELGVENNQLTSLPADLPFSLNCLYASNNQLTHLPDNLPDSLQDLNVEDNQLTSLPADLPFSLSYLNASNNQLRHLPAILPTFLETLEVENNPLDSDYQARSDFLTKLMCWHEGIDSGQWEKIYSEDHAGDFATFLDKLHQGKNRSSAALRGQVGRWLDYLAQDGHGELRQKTFVLANEAMASCVDRASYYFTQMQTLQTEHQLLSRDVSPEEMVKAILVNFRLQTLYDIATRQVAVRRAQSPGFAEDLEIYLAYQYKLREPLALPVYAELQFSEIAGLTDEDVHQARQTVLEAEKANFMHYWLIKSTLWEAILTKWDAEKRKAADEQYLEDIAEDNCKFKAEVDKRLRDLGIAVDDADARHGVSTQLADELLYAQRYQLTQEYLAEKRALSLLERFDSATL